MADGNIHDGHRARMRQKLTTHGDRVFHTYELLEMLLYSIVPYRDTNPAAKKLMERFGGIEGVLSASEDEILSVEGVGARIAELLSAIREFGDNLLSFSDKIYNSDSICCDLGEYVTSCLSGCGYTVAVFLFDNKMELITWKKLYDVDFSYAAIKADAFVNTALEYGASAIAVAHTHPYSAFYPTLGDIETNKLLRSALERVGVSMIEHYIVSGKRSIGMLNAPPTSFYQRIGGVKSELALYRGDADKAPLACL